MKDVSELLPIDRDFAVRAFRAFEKKVYPASGSVAAALAASMLLVAGCMLWAARDPST